MPIALRARLPLARHILATVLLAGAAASYYGYSAMHGGLWRDPAATLLYPIGVLGLALGMFWARYFVICFCASLAAIRLGGADWYAAWSYPWLWLQVGVALVWPRARVTYTHVLRTDEFEGQEHASQFGAVSLQVAF